MATLAGLFERWGALHASVHRRTWGEDQRVFRKYLAPFHGRRLNRIAPSEVAGWRGDVGEHHGPIQANRALTLLSTIYNFSSKLGYDGPNPCKGIRRFREQSRDRFLQPAEIKRFFAAVVEQPQPWQDFFLLLLFTGARRSSLLAIWPGRISTWTRKRGVSRGPKTTPRPPSRSPRQQCEFLKTGLRNVVTHLGCFPAG